MAFEHAGYKIERLDESNICLYRWQTVKHIDKASRAVTTSEEWIRLGYYLTFFGAARRLVDRLAEEAVDIEGLKAVVGKWEMLQTELAK